MTVDLIIPVFNEEAQLAISIRRLLKPDIVDWPMEMQIIICDNGSTDATQKIGRALALESSRVNYLRVAGRGRGGALKAAWMKSRAEIVAYMDVDLSTELEAFPRAVHFLSAGNIDIVTGCRNHPQSLIVRGWRRTFLSRNYNRLSHLITGTKIRDLQCGFKVVRRSTAIRLLPLVHATGWFFDTELLLIAEHFKVGICELPISWVDDEDSRVLICSTIWEELKGLFRMRRRLRSKDPADSLNSAFV